MRSRRGHGHAERAQAYQEASYADAARDEFERAVAADSSLGYGYAELTLLARGPEDAIRNVAAARARLASAAPVERALIENVSAWFNDDFAGFIRTANDLAALEPRNPRSWIAVSTAQSISGRTADARAALREAIAADSSYAPSYLILGESFIFASPEDIPQAERLIETGVRLWPSEPVSYLTLAELRRIQGRLQDAVAATSRAIDLDPLNGNSYNNRANAAVFAGQTDRASADYAAAFRRSPPNERVEIAMRRALIPAYRGDVDSSLAELALLESAIDGLRVARPAYDKAVVAAAELALAVRHGRLDVARHADSVAGPSLRFGVAAFGEAVIPFADASAAFQHGLVAVYSGDYAAARHFADEVVRIRAADNAPMREQPAHLLRGEAARLQHDYPRALDELALADSNGTAIVPTYLRALTLEAMGRRDEARALYKKVAEFYFASPDNAAVHYDAMKRLAALK